MLEAFILTYSCLITLNLVEYKDSSYHSVKVLECSKGKSKVSLPVDIKTVVEDSAKVSLAMVLNADSKLLITSEVYVKRPWIAPIPIFMEVAKSKHNEKLAEELFKLVK